MTRRILTVVRWTLILGWVLAGQLEVLVRGQSAPAPGQKDEFSMSVGAGLIVSPRPYPGAGSAVFPVPVVDLEYKRWYFEGIRGGLRLFQEGRLSANAFAQAQFKGLEPGDSPFLEGMDARRKSADGGLELVYRGRPVGFRLGVLSDLLSRSGGQEVSLQAVSGMPLGKAFLLGGFGPRWLSSDRVDYYYGVRQAEARPGRPVYRADATWNWDLSLGVIWRPAAKWNLLVLFNREDFGETIRNSPLIEQGYGASLITSLTYSIW